MSAKINKSIHEQLLKDKKFLKALRGLCPDGVHCTSIEITEGGRSSDARGPTVILTRDTRDRIDDKLRKLEKKP